MDIGLKLKKMPFSKFLFLLSFLIIGFSFNCSNDDSGNEASTPPKEYRNVQEPLWPYFEQFEKAGLERGIEIDFQEKNIVALIEEIEVEEIGGKCTHPVPGSNRIIINESFFLNTDDESLKELVIFHELGHCYLGRDHRDESFQNGACKSIMRSGLGNCLDNYKSSTKERYLDELFDPDSF